MTTDSFYALLNSKGLNVRSLDEQALAYELFEWKCTHLDPAKDSSQLWTCLKQLDSRIKSRTYLVCDRLTAVDVYLAKHLAQILAGITAIDFRDKVVLAPMVRVSTHPMRLLALNYGADLVYSEELIDQRIFRSTRVVNNVLGTIDFVLPDGSITFRTCEAEKGRVLAQLGTPDAQRALKAAKILEDDVAAIDINMGCPKDYSIKGGMGAALLTKPDTIKEILTTLTNNLSIPVTCKIRILPNLEDTLSLVKLIEGTGVAALTVHGRIPAERPRHMNHDDVIRAIADAVSIPVIANGGSKNTINLHDDIEYFRQQTGASSVMIARAAMWYPAIFCNFTDGKTPPSLHDLVREYLQLALRYDHNIAGTKYCVQQMLHREGTTEIYLDTIAARDLEEMSLVWGLHGYYKAELNRRSKLDLHHKRSPLPSPSTENCSDTKRAKTESDCPSSNEGTRVCLSIPYERRYWPPLGPTPKQLLQEHCKKHKFRSLDFIIKEVREARLFFCTVSLNDQLYENTFGCKSKKCAEQAGALVCLQSLGVPNGKMDITYEAKPINS